MKTYALYFLRRFGQFVLVVFVGINIVFFVTHATPIDPVEQAISSAMQFGHSDPRAVEIMREALRELYGLDGTLWQQYLRFWGRLATGDFRSVDLRLSHPGFDVDPPVAAVDGRAAVHIDAHRVERRQFSWRPCRLLSQEPAAEGGRCCGHRACNLSRAISCPSSCSSCSAISGRSCPSAAGSR